MFKNLDLAFLHPSFPVLQSKPRKKTSFLKLMKQICSHGFIYLKIAFFCSLKGSVREKCDKKALLIATNLIFICCVYKEKIVKNNSYLSPCKFRKLQHSTRIVKKINLIPNKSNLLIDASDRSKISIDQKRFFSP